MMKPNFGKTLSIAILGVFTATLLTFSQENEEKAPSTLTFPMENITISNKDGREITVTVLSRNDQGITILQDGLEYQVEWDQLSNESRQLLQKQNDRKSNKDGEITPLEFPREMIVFFKSHQNKTKKHIKIKILSYDEKGIKYTHKNHPNYIADQYWDRMTQGSVDMIKGIKHDPRIDEILAQEKKEAERKKARLKAITVTDEDWEHINTYYKKLEQFDAKERQQLLINNDPDYMRYLKSSKSHWIQDKHWKKGIPAWETHKKLDLIEKTENEHVSLRPEFEKLGIKAEQQVGGTCTLYSAYKLFEYTYKKNGKKMVSRNQFKNQ